MKLAFIDSSFPGLTTTFLNREFEYLRENMKFDITPISIRYPHKELFNVEYEKYVDSTIYLRPDCLLRIIFSNILMFFKKPILYVRTLLLIARNIRYFEIYRILQLFFHFFSGVYLASFLKKKKYDGIIAHFSSASSVAMFSHIFGKIPYVVTFHASEDIYRGAIFIREKIKYASAVITDSEYNIMQLNLLTGYEFSDKISTIYNSIQTSKLPKADYKTGLKGKMKLLSVGSFSGCKGYPTVLKALQQLKTEFKITDFVYTIIGGGNRNEENMIRKLISEYDLKQNVVLLGRQNNSVVFEEVLKTDIFVMASEIFDRGIRDGFPTVISEAMMLKRVVVSTYVSNIPFVIKHEETGFLFPEKKYSDLSKLLFDLHNNFGKTVEITKAAYELAKSKFDSERNYKNLVQILSSSIGK